MLAMDKQGIMIHCQYIHKMLDKHMQLQLVITHWRAGIVPPPVKQDTQLLDTRDTVDVI